VASSLLALVAQRLVRKICPECKRVRPATEEEMERLGYTPEEFMAAAGQNFGFVDPARPAPQPGMVYQAVGCSSCMGTGYKGRTGIYEMLMMNDEVRAMVLKDTDSNTIKKLAVQQGMRTLRMDGARKILSGWSTIEEVMRVTQEDTA